MEVTSGVKLLPLFLLLWSLITGASSEKRVESVGAPNQEKYEALDIVGKSPSAIINLRGFSYTKHNVHTKDGYYLSLIRLINPKLQGERLKRPILFNHGFCESATIWLINSFGLRPVDNIHSCSPETLHSNPNGTHFLNGPMLLSNSGYDVWLLSMRGTDFSLRHDTLKYKKPEFWNYCLDDFALVDVPTSIDYIRKTTGASKVGYIGHSQATFSIFGLLSARPNYAEVVEPVIAVAPVAFFDHITSVLRPVFVASLTATDKDKHGPFPPQSKLIRKAVGGFCKAKGDGKVVEEKVCQFLGMLIAGKGNKFNPGYYAHVPFYSSLKVVRHFGQLIEKKRYTMYDYGPEENQRIYGKTESPSYPVHRIKSQSLVLVSTKSDALSSPKDVEHFKSLLKVPIFKEIFIDGDFDHFDLLLNDKCKGLVFKPILEVLETFEAKTGICSLTHPDASYHDILEHNFHQEMETDPALSREWEDLPE